MGYMKKNTSVLGVFPLVPSFGKQNGVLPLNISANPARNTSPLTQTELIQKRFSMIILMGYHLENLLRSMQYLR